MTDDCPNGWTAPSVGYQNGCRCDRCCSWRRRIDMRRRLIKRVAVSRVTEEIVPPGRSATTVYNDILDWWDGL